MANAQYIVDDNGEKTAVVLSLEEYELLLEDMHDLAIIAERKDEPGVDQEELEQRLIADGLL